MPPKRIECNPNCKPSFKQFNNGISTKMIQAQMIRSKKGIPIVNSRTETIYKDIYSMDFEKNKQMLIRFQYALYRRYFDSIASCSVGSEFVKKLNEMLQDIIASLTEEEYNRVFGIVIPPPPPAIDTNPVTEYTFYVITRVTPTITYFIIKNIRPNFIIQAGKMYTFDLSDPSNHGTRFCLSYDKNGRRAPGLFYVGTPGNPDSRLIYTLPKYINNLQVYVFNELDIDTNTNKLLYSAYTIWGYNNPYIVTNVGMYLAINDITKYLTKCIIQDSVLAVFESNKGPQYFINNNTNEGPDLFFKVNLYQYAVTYGTYYLYIPKFFEATLLNHGMEDCISFVGDDDKKSVDYLTYVSLAENNPPDGSYNFYWDIVKMSIYKPFDKHVSVYSKKFGFMYGMDLLLFKNDCVDYGKPPKTFEYFKVLSLNYDYYGLCAQNRINIIDDIYITFNDHLTYTPTRIYSLYLGEYLFFIPETTPIAFLNRNKEDIVFIEGLSNTYYLNTGPDGHEYKFYYGIIRVTIKGNFGFLSFCSLKKGYMGGYKVFNYDSRFSNSISYPDQLSVPTINYLRTNTFFSDIVYYQPSYTNLILHSSDLTISPYTIYSLIREQSPSIQYNYITTNGGFNINGVTSSVTSRFSLTQGIYVFSSIGNKMAMMNDSLETKISYTGGGAITSGRAPNGKTYQYYKDYLIVHVYSKFGFISFDILGGVYGNYAISYF
jgi:hypothetical protein